MPQINGPVTTRFREEVGVNDDQPNSVTRNISETSLPKMESENSETIHLTWRSWVVVLVTCFAQLSQVFVIAGSGQNVAFIARDLGNPGLAGWIVQSPLLMQAVLSPIAGRLSDLLDRKWLVSVPPVIALVGAVVSATARSMSMVIGGGILIGTTLSTISIVQAIPSEVLPRKYRAVANGAGFIGSGIGGIVGTLGAGKMTSLSTDGWRYIFWTQAVLHGVTALLFAFLYHPRQRQESPRLKAKEYLWAVDPVGSILFMVGTAFCLLALDWVSTYGWSDVHIIVPLSIGLVSLVGFATYEWIGRDDGIVTHAYFKTSQNFALATFALVVEGWIFYSAVNSVVPQLTLNLGFEDNAWSISVRQLSSSLTTLAACIPITWYATKFKDMRSPLLVTFVIFLAATICYSFITPNLSAAQIGYNVLIAVGQAGPLTLLVATIQLATPHEHLATATGLAFSARAIGGAFGSAVLTVIIDGKLNSSYRSNVGAAAVEAGLSESAVDSLINALQSGDTRTLNTVVNNNQRILDAAMIASRWTFARAYRLAWLSIIPFVVLAIIAVGLLRTVKDLMTENVEATVELCGPSARTTTEKAV